MTLARHRKRRLRVTDAARVVVSAGFGVYAFLLLYPSGTQHAEEGSPPIGWYSFFGQPLPSESQWPALAAGVVAAGAAWFVFGLLSTLVRRRSSMIFHGFPCSGADWLVIWVYGASVAAAAAASLWVAAYDLRSVLSLVPLAIPVAVPAVALVAMRHQSVLVPAAVVFQVGFVVLAGFTIGKAYLPSAALLAAGAAGEAMQRLGGRRRHR